MTDYDGPRVLGPHAGCGGNVLYGVDGHRGRRWCERCGMSSHYHWRDSAGVVQPPLSPSTEEEAKGVTRG